VSLLFVSAGLRCGSVLIRFCQLCIAMRNGCFLLLAFFHVLELLLPSQMMQVQGQARQVLSIQVAAEVMRSLALLLTVNRSRPKRRCMQQSERNRPTNVDKHSVFI
jgi:NADH:ubiquinone oxidoreductase subunit K